MEMTERNKDAPTQAVGGPFAWLVQSTTERNPPHGWAVYMFNGQGASDAVPVYLQSEVYRLRDERDTHARWRQAMADRLGECERARDALEFAEYLAKQAEYLLTALEYEDMARVAWYESGAGTPEFERWDNATDSRGEHAKKLRERIYEFRKRVPRDPHYPCRSDGRCQYAIDHGAEDMGHCPAGKCAMPEGA